MALIQILAYDKLAKRTHEGLNAQLRRDPLTADTWTEIGQQHPELFRVLEAEKHSTGQETVTLIARFVQEGIPSDNQVEPPKSLPLSPDQTSNLINLAIQLHDREVQRSDRWKTVIVPMVVAIIAAGASIIGAIISTSKDIEDSKEVTSERIDKPVPTKSQETTKTELPTTKKQEVTVEKKGQDKKEGAGTKTAPNKPIQPTLKSDVIDG